MIRIVSNKELLSNLTNCQNDEFFCYPISHFSDVRLQYRGINFLNNVTIEVWDKGYNTLLQSLTNAEVKNYFAFEQRIYNGMITGYAYDFQMIQPLPYNCFALKITTTSSNGPEVAYTEPICYVAEYCENVYEVVLPNPNLTNNPGLILTTSLGTVTTLQNGLTTSNGVYYTGSVNALFDSVIRIYLPCGETITSATSTNPLYNPVTLTNLGEQNKGFAGCNSNLKLKAIDLPIKDCSGNYYKGVTDVFTSNLPERIEQKFEVVIPCGEYRQMSSKIEFKKVGNSCRIDKSMITHIFRIKSPKQFPPYYESQIIELLSNKIVVMGSNPIADSNGTLLELYLEGESMSEVKTYGKQFLLNAILQTCPCDVRYLC